MRADTTDNFNFDLKLSFNINLRCYKYIFIELLTYFAEISNQERWWFFPATKHSKSLTRNRDIGNSEVSVACCHSVTKPCPTPLWPHGLKPTRLLCPRDFPGKNTGVVAISFFRGSYNSGIKLVSPALAGKCFTIKPPRKPIYGIELHKMSGQVKVNEMRKKTKGKRGGKKMGFSSLLQRENKRKLQM